MKNGKYLTWDYTCIDTLCDTYVNESSKEGGEAAKIAYVVEKEI